MMHRIQIIIAVALFTFCISTLAIAQKFDFNSGNTQGWTMQGAYDESLNGPYQSNFTLSWTSLVNYPTTGSGKGSLLFYTSGGHGISGSSGTYWIMQFSSPNLSGNSSWQNTTGVSAKFVDNMTVGSTLYANIIITVYDKDQSMDRSFFSNQLLNNPLTYSSWFNANAVWSNLNFNWSTISTFPTNYTVKKITIQIMGTMTGLYEGQVGIDEIVGQGGGTTPTAPAAPSNCSTTLVAPTTIDITWQDNSNNEDNFYVEKKYPDGTWIIAGIVGPNVTYFHDPGLEPGDTYCYRVRAKNSVGYSAYSNESCKTTTISANTPSGGNIIVDVGDGAQITFDQVINPGNTNLELAPVGPIPPENFIIIPPEAPVYYDINTTATFNGAIHLALPYDDTGLNSEQEEHLGIFHYIEDQTQWLGITTSVDIENNMIFGDVEHLSVFAVMLGSGGSGGSSIVTNCEDSGPGSLRDAITNANTNPGPDVITFEIPNGVPGHDADAGIWIIHPQSQLPTIADPELIINGFSQAEFIGSDTNPHGPEIVLDGSAAGQYMSGLSIQASGVEVLGLTINNFYSVGIDVKHVEGGRIAGCYVGTSFNGDVAEPNGYGIYIYDHSQNVEIAPADTFHNIISGNTNGGIFVSDSSQHVHIIGNIIGLNRKGTMKIGNENYGGICIQNQSEYVEVFDNWIGGNKYGIYMIASSQNAIANNWIGTIPEHENPDMGNSFGGIYISQASYDNQILENVIWYNGTGVRIYGPEPMHNRISRNSIAHSVQSGIIYDSGDANVIPAPTITSVTENSVTGTAIPDATIEIYTDSEDEGEIFQDQTTSDGSGNFHWEGTIIGPYHQVTALVITADGSTSYFSRPVITGIDRPEQTQLPDAFTLDQNYPNPFNPETTIQYSIPGTGVGKVNVRLQIFNIKGELIRTVINEQKSSGVYKVVWDGTSDNNSHVTSGVYIYKIHAGEFSSARKMIITK
ncbi:right-handed parallel beta-helix repeat-containing protein [candidate division KSB1 bacterium]|nr:right-handed parallel beta-helix repeat-containing protein [candidate division KSB1 bacterium]